MKMENLNKSCEPMDIDLSANSVHEMDISFIETVNDAELIVKREHICTTPISTPVSKLNFNREAEDVTLKPKFQNIKKYHINKQFKAVKTHIPSKIILSVIFAVLLSIITYHIFDIKCSGLNLEHLRETLSKKVYGQTEAVTAITEALEAKVESKILLFTGSTGVGKTYTASIIMENIGFSSNTYHYTMPSFANTFSTDLMLGLTFCDTSTVIVDDISIDDVKVISHIEDIVLKTKTLEKNVTIILIYNCDYTEDSFIRKCDDNFYTRLLHTYKNVRALKKLIQFKPLNEDCLIKCIENEMGSRKIHEQERNRVLKHFNVSLDGCKGVHTKMKFLNIV